jgi:hypothetical protein
VHHHHHRQRQQHQHQQHQGGGDETQHAAASDSGGAARGGGVDEWSVCWAQFAQPADDPALERQLLRQVHRPRPARGWTVAAQSVCTFPPPVRSPPSLVGPIRARRTCGMHPDGLMMTWR